MPLRRSFGFGWGRIGILELSLRSFLVADPLHFVVIVRVGLVGMVEDLLILGDVATADDERGERPAPLDVVDSIINIRKSTSVTLFNKVGGFSVLVLLENQIRVVRPE